MFDILSGVTKVAISPLRGVSEAIDDISGSNSDEEQVIAISSLGLSSLVKGTAKGVKSGCDDIFG